MNRQVFDATPLQEVRAPKSGGSRRRSEKDWWRDLGMSVAATYRIEDVEKAWRQLEESGIESPGQSLDFTKVWIEHFGVSPDEQLYVTGTARGKVVALFPLIRRKRYGIDILTWFPGPHVGCNAPLMDHETLALLSDEELSDLWNRMLKSLFGADAVVLHSMPALGKRDYFQHLGDHIDWDVLYRSEFENWDECAKVQHTRSRRKHDRQQGAKLAAMGEVTFEEVSGRTADHEILDCIEVMFEQKAKRFAEWGVEDPFEHPLMREFYKKVFQSGGTLEGKLHVLRLDGKIVSMRYNLVHGKRVFALVSSMDDSEELKPGSPGKQNLLRSMEAIFASGHTMCDMGAGYSDEKRAWCNVEVPLRTHYIPLNAKGAVGIKGHQFKGFLKREIKANPALFNLVKGVRAARNLARPE